VAELFRASPGGGELRDALQALRQEGGAGHAGLAALLRTKLLAPDGGGFLPPGGDACKGESGGEGAERVRLAGALVLWGELPPAALAPVPAEVDPRSAQEQPLPAPGARAVTALRHRR
jgi:hypothetical protein